MTIPDRERGYSVETSTAIVHERYQTHAPNAQRVRTLEGVQNVALGREPVLCPDCFPAPKATPVVKASHSARVTQRQVDDASYMAEMEDRVLAEAKTVANAPTGTVHEEWRKS